MGTWVWGWGEAMQVNVIPEPKRINALAFILSFGVRDPWCYLS